jgi:hypothetical protein
MDSDEQFVGMFGKFIKTKLSELIQKYFHDEVKVEPFTVNKETIVKMTGVSQSMLDHEFFPRTEVLAVERPKGRKRLWRYPEIKELWYQYLDEQYLAQYGVEPPKTVEKNKGAWTIYYMGTIVKDRRIVALKEGERVVSDKEANRVEA